MEALSLAKAGLFGLLVGVGGYVFSCAMHVWLRRNRSAAQHRSGLLGHLAHGFSGLLVVGLGLIAVTPGWRELVPRNGHLTSDGLLAVRLPDDRTVAAVTQAKHVAAGETLVWFSCPEIECQIRVLQLRQKSLMAEKSILANQPLKLNPELVRRYQEMVTDRRQMRVSLDQLSPARNLVVREKLWQLLDKRQRLQELEGEVARSEKELKQTSAKLAYAKSALQRTQEALRKNVATTGEFEKQQTETRIAGTEVERVQVKLESLKATREGLKHGLREYETVAVAQSKDLATDIGTAKHRMKRATERTEDLVDQLGRDAVRARELRAKETERLEIEIAQTKAKCSGLQKSLAATAPFSGEIAYRDPSPQAAGGKAPLVILAGKHALRVRVRLSSVEANALAKEQEVTLVLDEPGVQHRFVGEFLRSGPLPAEPGYVAVELACSPPERSIRDLVDEDQIQASLAWRPPLTIYPLFWAGLALACAGVVGRVGIGLRARKAKAQEAQQPAQTGSAGVDGPGSVVRPRLPGATVSAEAPNHGHLNRRTYQSLGTVNVSTQLTYVLGEQLRRMLADDQRDESLLRGLEWILPHTSTQDILHIRQGLNGDPAVHERIREIEQRVCQGEDIADLRLAQVLRVVAQDVLREAPTCHGSLHPVALLRDGMP